MQLKLFCAWLILVVILAAGWYPFKKRLKDNNIQADTVNTPYIFTHIKLSDNSIIVQTVNNFSCSPTKLLEALKS